MRRIAATIVAATIVAVVALPSTAVAADPPDFSVPGTGTGPTGAQSLTVWYANVSQIFSVRVRGTIETSANSTVKARWVCANYYGTIYTLSNNNAVTAQLGNLDGGQPQMIPEQVRESSNPFCAFTIWAESGAFRVSSPMVDIWLLEGGGGPLPTPEPTPTPEPSPSPEPGDADIVLWLGTGQNATQTRLGGASGEIITNYKLDDLWGATANVRFTMGPSAGWGRCYVSLLLTNGTTSNEIVAHRSSNMGGTVPTAECPASGSTSLTVNDVVLRIGDIAPPRDNPTWDRIMLNGGSGSFGNTGFTALVEIWITAPGPNGEPLPTPPPQDSDGDGFSDQVEAGAGTDPHDPDSYPGGFGGNPPPPSSGGGNPGFDICDQGEMRDTPLCQPASPGASAPPNSGGGSGIPENGGGNLGSGWAGGECEAEYPKPGMIDYAEIAPCVFPTLHDLDIFGFIADLLAWIGCLLGNIPGVIGNAIAWVVNRAIDLVVPSNCFFEMVDHFVAAMWDAPPLQWIDAVATAITDSLEYEGSPDWPTWEFAVGSASVEMDPVPLMITQMTTGMAPYRGLIGAAAYFGMIWATFDMLVSFFWSRSQPKQLTLGLD